MSANQICENSLLILPQASLQECQLGICSVPLPKSFVTHVEHIEIVDDTGNVYENCANVLSRWNDTSIRWLHLQILNIEQTTAAIYLRKSPVRDKSTLTFDLTATENPSCVSLLPTSSDNAFDAALELTLNQHTQVHCGVSFSQSLSSQTLSRQQFLSYTNTEKLFEIKEILNVELATSNGLTASLDLTFTYNLFIKQAQVSLSVTNKSPLDHDGGQWDLGNKNSLHITRFGFKCMTPIDELVVVDDITGQSINTNHGLSITQYSSGGENWQSPVHKTANNRVELQHKGSLIEVDSKRREQARISPTLQCKVNGDKVEISPLKFWQKFPAKIDFEDQSLSMEYVLKDAEQLEELQPGERKSHKLVFNLATQPARKLRLATDATLFENTNILPFYELGMQRDPIQEIVDLGLTSQNNFFMKRELLDEYGWRNFGDLYADHEAHNFKGPLPFVSHYNNQYDPLLGFLKQWILSSNSQWYELAEDLFQHIVDIDIYHTLLDKPDYNQGLFWHTDHYTQAETATHRTYSKHQAKDIYIDHAGGGGPGSHHCYTSGLALYYQLTKNNDALETVVNLTEWLTKVYESDGTLLGKFLQLKNANYLNIPFTQKLIFGFGTGVVRNPITNTYPLDRGTGNYVNALLDAFELTRKNSYLSQAEFVILNTIGFRPAPTTEAFEDIENTWYYTVFLQSVAKYLHFIEHFSLKRDACYSIIESFLRYIDYIADHEEPYLNSADKLEFANDTWTAQDLRKEQLLCIGYLYTSNPERREVYKQKAQYFNSFIAQKLQHSEEKSYTRILALCMQNYGGLSLIEKYPNGRPLDCKKHLTTHTDLNQSLFKRSLRFLREYSVSKEFSHLKKRIPKLQKWIGKP
ncbi:hypothetical protein [Glaciecola sp. 1036]|uniref:hypothetical protein n=1 Tax=Alteromonadaceae TaxID=72275 RepID=UPI003CFBDB68